METEADHLSLPQEPGSPAKTKEVIDEVTDIPSLPQEPTSAEQVMNTLTQEPALVDETVIVTALTPAIPKAPASVPEATPRPPTRDQLLRESIENDYNRVLQWKKWCTAPLETFIETFEAMKDEEKFALEWIGTKDVYEALRLETIRRVLSYKMTNRSLGKDKAPAVCIELNKPPSDPAFVEEMKIVRYAMLISKVKTILEKEHQNDPNCTVNGSKDEHGREIDTAKEDEKNDEDKSEKADEDEDESDDDEDADDENDDHDDDDDSGNDNNRADPDYDSESPLLVGPDYNEVVPEGSPSQESSSNSDDKREASHQPGDVSNDHLEDLSRAIVPHVQPMDETPIKREEAIAREGKLEASPIFLSSTSGGKKDAPLQE
ncbi:PREDICTED: FK506-binding protein 3-like [Ipomoea nil]|uniref:FK506-binding protein 3-like n=1 Tax=Ipomoea nil TaxID=35883 RepID=UPI00090103B6|nr:PREDICTED: FK506-binding protein 3-like [Ipomoea nil]